MIKHKTEKCAALSLNCTDSANGCARLHTSENGLSCWFPTGQGSMYMCVYVCVCVCACVFACAEACFPAHPPMSCLWLQGRSYKELVATFQTKDSVNVRTCVCMCVDTSFTLSSHAHMQSHKQMHPRTEQTEASKWFNKDWSQHRLVGVKQLLSLSVNLSSLSTNKHWTTFTKKHN